MKESTGRPTADLRHSLKHNAPATKKATAIAQIEDLIKGGKTVRAAVEEVAYQTGVGERSLFTYLHLTKGVPREQWDEALARKRASPKPRESCNPDALQRFIELGRKGGRVTDCYRQLMAEATEKGWEPIPSERTMRRKLEKQVSSSDRWMARRATAQTERF
jgi:putative transposase